MTPSDVDASTTASTASRQPHFHAAVAGLDHPVVLESGCRASTPMRTEPSPVLARRCVSVPLTDDAAVERLDVDLAGHLAQADRAVVGAGDAPRPTAAMPTIEPSPGCAAKLCPITSSTVIVPSPLFSSSVADLAAPRAAWRSARSCTPMTTPRSPTIAGPRTRSVTASPSCDFSTMISLEQRRRPAPASRPPPRPRCGPTRAPRSRRRRCRA